MQLETKHLGILLVLLIIGVCLVCSSAGGGILLFTGALCPTIDYNCPPTPVAAATVEISFYSANTKEDWVNAATEIFNASQIKTASGKTILVNVTHVTSGGSQQNILNGKIKPVAWSPGDQSWVDGLNQSWEEKSGQSLISELCQPTVYAPVGFAMWRPYAEALGWPDTPISWNTLVTLAADPEGWGSYDHPEWGLFKFGHTHPSYSNSGLLVLTALAYDTVGKTSSITPSEIRSEEVQEAFRQVELNTYHYGLQSRDLIALMIRNGPEYLHAVNTSEAETLRTNREAADQLPYPLAFIFPGNGTFWTEQPFCILNGDWVTPEQQEAAKLYRAYLLAEEQQLLAVRYNLRPTNPNVPVTDPFTLENGTDPNITIQSIPALASPTGKTAEAVKEVFQLTKKHAAITVLIDTSESMTGEKMTSASEAVINFIKRLHPEDEITVMDFNYRIQTLQPAGRVGAVGDELSAEIRNLRPDGDTALYDAICAATEQLGALRAEHEAAEEKRMYVIIVLSDGNDTASQNTEKDMLNCIADDEEIGGLKIFTIAYGADADRDLLKQIADETNGKLFTSDPQTIESAFSAISAEQ